MPAGTVLVFKEWFNEYKPSQLDSTCILPLLKGTPTGCNVHAQVGIQTLESLQQNSHDTTRPAWPRCYKWQSKKTFSRSRIMDQT